MNHQELKNVLDLHRKWLAGESDGKRADLRSANLRYTDLRSADLRYTDLRSADLRSANLSSANLSYTDLNSADLRSADLRSIKEDFFKVLSVAKAEVLGLYDALMRGKISGTAYEGDCACLVGTIANIRHEQYKCLTIDLKPNAERLSEKWFLGISENDLPQNNPISSITAEWMREWMDAEKIKYPKYEITPIWEEVK
jgi:hypothetical protein